MSINNLLFELIQVSLGTRISLSHSPNADEWGELYSMAKKQSLVGVCFAGVQRLQMQEQAAPEITYLTWMGMAAKIQQRNEVVNRQSVDLQERLSADGMQSCILKGQGVAALYRIEGKERINSKESDLSLLRQSGDIDVWVQNRSIEELVDYCKQQGVNYKATAAHVECEMLEGTDVELHAEPAFMRNFRTDRKLKKWFAKFDVEACPNVNGLVVPSVEFNLVYMMVHMYHHVLFEGMGLRQIMDYYFVLLAYKTKTIKTADSVSFGSANLDNADSSSEIENRFSSSAAKSPLDADGIEEADSAKNIKNIHAETLKHMKLQKFASGIMWIMKEVFIYVNDNHNDDFFLGIKPSEKYGKLILEDVMTGGNFGHHDEKNKGLHGGSAIGRSLNGLKRNMKFFELGPCEILSSPIWSSWHWWWRKRHGLL